MSTKRCSRCHIDKNVTEFGPKKSNKNGLEARCKACRAKIERTNKYKLSESEIEQMSQKQNHCCAICSAPQSSFKNKLAIDHCHKTGKVRGLLCSNCNHALGKFKDKISILKKAIEYLRKMF